MSATDEGRRTFTATLTDTEVAELIEDHRPLVKKTSYTVWAKAGSPPGIRPDDLYNACFAALLDAAREYAKPLAKLRGPFASFAKTAMERDAFNHLQALQVGAVTAHAVTRPDGTKGRFAYAVSTDVGEAEDGAPAVARAFRGPVSRESRQVKRLQKRMRDVFSMRDFQQRSAVALDYEKAASMIPERDQTVLWFFELVQRLSPGELPPELWAFLDDSFRRRKTPLAVTQDLLRNWAAPDQVAAYLERIARWINAYCDGQPLAEYPPMRAFDNGTGRMVDPEETRSDQHR
jgi:DNA-directed RNA polymerase specialized sigma24 family protein